MTSFYVKNSKVLLVPYEIIRRQPAPHGVDEDGGLPHLWHIITNAAFLCELDVDDSQKMATPYIVARSNIPITKEEMENLKNLIAKQDLDVGHLLKPNICKPDKEE